MNRLLLPAVSLLLGSALVQSQVQAQTETAPKAPGYSVAELERLIGGRTLVTVDLKNATLEQVAAALSQSTGIKFDPPETPPGGWAAGGLPEPTFTLSSTGQPFWEAVRDWHRATIQAKSQAKAAARAQAVAEKKPFREYEFTPRLFTATKTEHGMRLQMGDSLARGRAVVAWPFLLIGHNLRRTQDGRLGETGLRELELPTAQAPAAPEAPLPEEKLWKDRLVFTPLVFPDPKLPPLSLSCEILEAVDEKGNDLRLQGNALDTRNFSRVRGAQGGTPETIVLQSKPEMGTRLTKLRGVLRFEMTTQTQHWESTELATPVEDVLGLGGDEFKIRFNGLTKNDGGWEAGFSVQSRGQHLKYFWETSSAAVRRSNSLRGMVDFSGASRAVLLDANGNALAGQASRTSSKLLHRGNETAGPPVPDYAPVPVDAATDWSYSEEYKIRFRPKRANRGGPATGAKLIVDFPIERREVVVPFEFTDLPLPPS
jgi:hypothetical protein